MSYSLLKRNEFTHGEYKIVPIRDEDKFTIMQWRNDQIDILRQKELLTRDIQTRYFEDVVKKEFKMDKPNQILVAFLLRETLIGYGGLVHIHWNDMRGEVSFLLETTRSHNIELVKREYKIFLTLIKILAFEELKFNKITTEAFDIRPHIVETLENNGFELEGRLRNHNFIGGKYVDSLLHSCFSTISC